MLRSVLPTALSLAALLALPAFGAGVAIDGIEVGFGGAYKAGRWTPLTVRLEGNQSLPDSVVIETVTSDADGSASIRFSEPMTPDSSIGVVSTVVQAGRLGSELTVRLRTPDGNLLAERRLRYGSEALPEALVKGSTLWVTAGGLSATADEPDAPAFPFPEGIVGASLASTLPIDRLAYSGAELLIVRGDLSPTAEQSEAIRAWVAGGGHLAIALGRFTDEYRLGPLAKWVPVKVGETVQLRDLSPLEAYSGSRRRLPARVRVRVAQLSGAAELLPDGSDSPIIARSPYGFGRVTLFAIDLDDFPFASWAGLPGLIERALLDTDGGTGSGRRIVLPGLSDLGTQLLRSQESFSGVDRPTVGTALLLLLVYALIVGPLDYLLVHRILKRPALTWITLPLLVAAAGWWLHDRALAANGTASRFNELHVVDLDDETGTLRCRTDLTIYAAEPTRADLTVAPRFDSIASDADQVATPRLAWSSPPEEAFGGTFRNASGGLFRPEYVMRPPGEAASADAVPFLIWASRSFETSWQRADAGDLVDAGLTSRGQGRLEGTIEHHLPGPITAYVVAFGNRVFVPREPDWYPGEPIDLGSAAFTRSDLVSFLTRRVESRIDRKAGDGGAEYIVTETAYDPFEADADAVMQMLTFHAAAGGRGYTGLTNTQFARDDLTPLLRLGRAVVLGRIQEPAADVTVTPAEGAAFEPARQTSFVRIVLPTVQADVGPVRILPPADPNAARGQPRAPRRE